MNKRTTNIVIIVAIFLVCSCLPLCLGAFGLINALPRPEWVDLGGDSEWYGLGGICLSMLGFVIAAVVAIILLRKKSETPFPPEEPIPPVS